MGRPYHSPGKDLCDNFYKSVDKKIVLLENHGLICCGDSFKEVFDLSLKINQLCKEWLITNSKTFKTFNTKLKKKESDCFLFPDAAVLPSDNLQINNYILHIQEEVGLEPNCLTKEPGNFLLHEIRDGILTHQIPVDDYDGPYLFYPE